jgi:hypothetical protein
MELGKSSTYRWSENAVWVKIEVGNEARQGVIKMNLYEFIQGYEALKKANEARKTLKPSDPIYVSLLAYCKGIEDVLKSIDMSFPFGNVKRRL